MVFFLPETSLLSSRLPDLFSFTTKKALIKPADAHKDKRDADGR
jgi:hypothetical protein